MCPRSSKDGHEEQRLRKTENLDDPQGGIYRDRSGECPGLRRSFAIKRRQ
jgi:hypothetical protein